jgi:uncharacterized protein YaeQ
MAIKSVVYKVNIGIADIDHGYYADHALTIAKHPSETDERMMIRLLTFALQAYQLDAMCNGDAVMAFGPGLSDAGEPDVYIKDYTDQFQVWIEVGQPDDRAIIKASNKSEKAFVYAYQHASHVWFKNIENKLSRLRNLEIFYIEDALSAQLESMAKRSMQLQATIQEGQVMFSDGERSIDITPIKWL